MVSKILLYFYLFKKSLLYFNLLNVQAYASQTFTLYSSSSLPGQVIDETTKLVLTPNKPLFVLIHGFKPLGLSSGSWQDSAREAIHQKVTKHI